MNFFRSLLHLALHGEDPDAETCTPYQAADARRAEPCGDPEWLAHGRDRSATATYDDPIEAARWLEIEERANELHRGEVLRQIPDRPTRIEIEVVTEREFRPARERK